METSTLEQVRAAIDALDVEIVRLMAERGRWVERAAALKRTEAEARAPARVEQVIGRVKALAVAHGLDARVIEATYRAMIGAFVALELERVAATSAPGPVYAVLEVRVKDREKLRAYVQGHLPTIALHGGRVLARSLENEAVEGAWSPPLLVLHEWPSEAAFRAWYASDDYRPWKDLREQACELDLVLMKGR